MRMRDFFWVIFCNDHSQSPASDQILPHPFQGGFHLKLPQISGNPGGLWEILLRECWKVHRNRNKRIKAAQERCKPSKQLQMLFGLGMLLTVQTSPCPLLCLHRGSTTKIPPQTPGNATSTERCWGQPQNTEDPAMKPQINPNLGQRQNTDRQNLQEQRAAVEPNFADFSPILLCWKDTAQRLWVLTLKQKSRYNGFVKRGRRRGGDCSRSGSCSKGSWRNIALGLQRSN